MQGVVLRRRPGVAALRSAEDRDRVTRRKVGAAWALLFFNTLTYVPGGLLHLPSHVGKVLPQGALPLALLLALAANPRGRFRPSVSLGLRGLLCPDTVITVSRQSRPSRQRNT